MDDITLNSAFLRKLIFILFYLSLTAYGKTLDVSNEQEAWGNYRKYAQYIIKRDLFLFRVDEYATNYALVPEGNFVGEYDYSDRYHRHYIRRYFPRPDSVQHYEKNKTINYSDYIAYHLPVEVVDIIKSGSSLVTEKVMYFEIETLYFGTAQFYRIYGRLTAPEYSDLLIDLEDVSIRDSGSSSFGGISSCCRNHAPHPGILELASPNKSINSHAPSAGIPQRGAH